MAGYRLIYCVVNMGASSKTIKIAKKYGVDGGTIFLGRGTVNSRLPGILGLNEVRKEIIAMIAENSIADEAIRGISEEMAFHKPHHGIAFSIAGINNLEKNEVRDVMYNAIYVVVPKGSAEDVVEAANKAGARGGTILNARGANTEEVKKLFSIEIEPEREVVFIIAKTGLKDGIVEAVKNRLKIGEPGNGVIFVTDINEVYGLHEEE